MRIVRGLIAIVAAMLLPASVSAQGATQIFKPAGPWAMEYADEGCRLIRNFSDGNAQLTLAFERFALKPSLRLGLTSAALHGFKIGRDIEYRYEGQTELRKERALRSILADGREAYLITGAAMVPPEIPAKGRSRVPPKPSDLALSMKDLPDQLKGDLEAASRVSSLIVVSGFDNPVSVELGSMAAPMKAMQNCVSDLVSSWGIDIPRLLAQSQPVTPIGTPLRWIGPEDYPRSKVAAGSNGRVSARLIVEPDGSIGKCMVDVIQRGEFERTVCDLLGKRAKFKPALDADGNALRAYWSSTWVFFVP